MSHAVMWTTTATWALPRLPEKVATAAVEFIYGSLAENPQRVGKPLRFEFEGLHSARRGDYRVVYEIDQPGETVTIIAIAPIRRLAAALKRSARMALYPVT